jgi:hypothetical protein
MRSFRSAKKASRSTVNLNRESNERNRNWNNPFEQAVETNRALEVNIKIKSDRVWFLVHRMNLPSPASRRPMREDQATKQKSKEFSAFEPQRGIRWHQYRAR